MVVEAQPSQAAGSVARGESKRYAVVVGINDYAGSDVEDLSFCAADAEAFCDALLTYCEYDPECVVLFSDGTHEKAQKPLRSSILAAIAHMCTCATDKDSILFFFAGHGTRDVKDSYLLTQEFNSIVVSETGIPMDTINKYFCQSEARFKMRFFDACHAGRVGARGVPVSPDIKRHFLVEGEGWATLSACKEDQYAHEDPELGHGIFSYCLVKGLSGDAAIHEQGVTLHSLITYTITNTIEITKERGLQQTPVSDGYHAGDLVLATVCSNRPSEMPPALVKVQETAIDQLRPTLAKVPQFLSDIRSVLQNEPGQQDYTARSQQEKLALGDKLVQQIHHWCQEQESQYHEQLEGEVIIAVERQSIQACPLNLQLAEYFLNSKIKQAVELKPLYRNETRTVQSGFGPAWLMPTYQTHEVLYGISERKGYYESSVLLTIRAQEPLWPVCAMVIAVIPTTFGLYILLYSCSTRLTQGQEESWDPDTLSLRTLHALPVADKEGKQTLEELQDLYPQLVSFFSESCTARKTYLRSIGISGQSLL